MAILNPHYSIIGSHPVVKGGVQRSDLGTMGSGFLSFLLNYSNTYNRIILSVAIFDTKRKQTNIILLISPPTNEYEKLTFFKCNSWQLRTEFCPLAVFVTLFILLRTRLSISKELKSQNKKTDRN